MSEDTQEPINSVNGREKLFAAAARGDCAEIKRILASPLVDVNAEELQSKNTALHLAAMNNRPDAIEVLVEAGANIDHTNKSNATPLYTAISRQSRTAAETLIRLGADLSIRCNNGMAPLHASVVLDVPALTRILLEAGADIDQTTQNGQTADALAEMYDHVQQERALMEYRSKVHTKRVKKLHSDITRESHKKTQPKPRI